MSENRGHTIHIYRAHEVCCGTDGIITIECPCCAATLKIHPIKKDDEPEVYIF